MPNERTAENWLQYLFMPWFMSYCVIFALNLLNIHIHELMTTWAY